MSLIGFFGLGIRQLQVTNLANGVGLMALLYLKLSIMLTLLLALGLAYWEATTAYLDHQGFNRLTISTTQDVGLGPEDLSRLEHSFPDTLGYRVIPEITTLIRLTAATGEPKAILATSYATDDPVFTEMPTLGQRQSNRALPLSRATGLILSPDILRRLGFQLDDMPAEFDVHISQAGRPSERCSWRMPVSAVSGDLGKTGARLPYQTMVAIRKFQHHGGGALADSVAPIEINSIHLLIPSEVAVDQVLTRLKAIDPHYQLASPWFERGKQRNLMSTTLTMIGPLLSLLVLVNVIVLFVLAWQKAKSDRKQLCLLTLSGASFAQLTAWYVLPQVVLYAMATSCGVLIAGSIYGWQVLPILEQAAGTSVSAQTPHGSLILLIVASALGFHALTAYRQTQRRNLERSLVT